MSESESKFCVHCGHQRTLKAKFCIKCGNPFLKDNSLSSPSQNGEKNENGARVIVPQITRIDEEIRRELRKFGKHVNSTCLECGYVGLVGVIKQKYSLFRKIVVWVTIAMMSIFSFLILPISFWVMVFVGLLLGFYMGQSNRIYAECPNCLSELVIK